MKIKAQNRDIVGKTVRKFRKDSLVPSVVYGPNRPSTNILLDVKEFRKLFDKVGYNIIFDLEDKEGKVNKALVKDIQRHPLNDQLLHVALYEIDMKKKIEVDVPVEIVGESMAVKNNLGFLEVPMEQLAIRCLPTNIPTKIVVDISKLDNVNDAVHIQDLDLGEGVELSSDESLETVVARITPPQKEEVVEEVAAPAEGEEGATPAEGEAKEGAESAAEETKE